MFPILTATEVTAASTLTSLWEMVMAFITGFIGAIVDVIGLIFANEWLALVIVAVPLAMLVFGWAKGLIKIKRK